MKSLFFSLLLSILISPELLSQECELLRDVGRMENFQPYEIDLDGHHMKTDNEGNIYIAGRFTSGSFYVGNGNPSLEDINSSNNYFVAKYSQSGDLIWASPLYSDEFTTGGLSLIHPIRSLYIDDKQNVYITGSYVYGIYSIACSSEIIEEGTGSLYYAKFNPQGECVYIKTGQSPGNASCTGISKSSDGRLFITGRFKDRLQFDDTLVIGTANPLHKIVESFIAEIDDKGDIINIKTLRCTPGNSILEINKLLVDRTGKLIIAGECNGRILFDDVLIGQQKADLFIARLTLDLEIYDLENWRYGFVEDGNLVKIYDLDELSDNKLMVLGYFMGTELKFNQNALSSVANKFHQFLKTIDFDSDHEILISTAGLRENGRNCSVRATTDGQYAYVLSTIYDTGTIGNTLIIEPVPEVYRQYLATIDPGTGECLSLMRMDIVKKVIGIEHSMDKIILAGNFDNAFKLGSCEVVSAPFNSDIYFGILDAATVKTETVLAASLINIYPNPAYDKLYLMEGSFDDLIIYSIQGQIIKVMQNQNSSIDISDLPSGMYLINYKDGATVKTEKIIKQ